MNGQQLRADGWSNLLTGLGVSGRDKRLGAAVSTAGRLTHHELEELFAGDGLGRRICELPAGEQTRKWVSISAENDAGKLMLQRLQELGAQDAVTEALIWARLYGGAAILLGADDGASPEEPLNEDRIRSLGWLTVLHRYEIEVASKVSDPFARDYGRPETYRVVTAQESSESRAGSVFHASRCIRFDGARTPRERIERNGGWCDSVLSHVIDALRDTWASYDSAAALLTDFSQAVYKVKGLASIVASDQSKALERRMEIMDMCRSVLHAVIVDADGEDFERKTTSLGGLPEVLDRLQQLLSAVTGIPVTLLMGRSPAGMNATGESDIRVFYDTIQSEQENHLRPKLERLLSLVFRAKDGPTRGREPKGWSFSFNPLWQLTDKETAEVRKTQAEVDAVYITNGVVLPEEIRQSRFSGEAYSSETIIDKDLEDIGAIDDDSSDDDQEPPSSAEGDAPKETSEE